MYKKFLMITNIPSIIWGKRSNKVYIAVHGAMSNKNDTVISMLADEVVKKGYQVLSFDLPENGDRKDDHDYKCNPVNGIHDLNIIMNYAKEHYEERNLFACSIGAYFSLLTYKNDIIHNTLFLSPIVNMRLLIENMMIWNNTTKDELESKKEISTNFGETLYWDYYQYTVNNPIVKWSSNASILYGDKDNMTSVDTIKEFKDKFNCSLDILNGGEHYFHTDEQLSYYRKWLKSNVR